MGALTYVDLKTVSSLMADWNFVSNPEFLMCFAQALIFFVLRISVNVPFFYSLSTSEFETEASFNEKIYFMRSGEKAFKSLNNSIVRRCEFLWCTETELSVLLEVLCKLIHEVFDFVVS